MSWAIGRLAQQTNSIQWRAFSIIDHVFYSSKTNREVLANRTNQFFNSSLYTHSFSSIPRNSVHIFKRTFYTNFNLCNHSFGLPFKFNSNQCLPKQSPQMSTDTRNEAALRNKYKPRECRFTTPYGHIAGLEWGQKESPLKILCMHGWLDNAGSFERLIPFILDHNENANKYHIIAMDQPGVGLSSHKPPGSEYTQITTVIEMRRILQQLGWAKVTLLSHSLGSHISFVYSCIYPNQVESLISIDLAHPITRQVHNWNISIANSIEEHFKYEHHHEDDPTTNIRVPVYSEVDAIKRLMDGHSASLTKDSAEVLLKRGAKKQRWGYTFTRDMRLRYLSPEIRADDDLMLKFLAEPFKPNLFILRALRSPYHRPEATRLKYYALFENNCPLFRDIMLDGTHHLHMNSPELVAPEINKFLDDVQAGTKGQGTVSIDKNKL